MVRPPSSISCPRRCWFRVGSTRNDEPVAGVRVTAYPTRMSMSSGPDAQPSADGGRRPAPIHGTTADDGSYELIVLEPGEVSVEPSEPRRQDAVYGLTLLDRPRCAWLHARLQAQWGAGLGHCRRQGNGPGRARCQTVHASQKKGGDDVGTSTGADGRFAFEVPPGEIHGEQWGAEGYARSRSDLSVGLRESADVRTGAEPWASCFLGKVGRSIRRPAAGQRSHGSGSDVGPGMDAAMTLGDGTFPLSTGFRSGPTTCPSGGASVGFAVQSGVTPGDKDVVLTLRPGGRLRLAVVDGSGAPVAEAQAWVVFVNGVPARSSHAIDPTDAAGTRRVCPCLSGVSGGRGGARHVHRARSRSRSRRARRRPPASWCGRLAESV
jgi:hypothetical protein